MVNRHRTAHNHTLAPITGAFVQAMRGEFGENVKVTLVHEGDIQMGKRDETPAFEARPYRARK
jgi:predicted small secreted protein